MHAPLGPSGEAVPEIGGGPLVRHLLRGVDLTAVHGTGRGGRITRVDVEPLAPKMRVTPYARRIAQDLGVRLAAVHGTGDGWSKDGAGGPSGGAPRPGRP
ncbi:E3 binding domain-containing protein [Streptomyces collinus]